MPFCQMCLTGLRRDDAEFDLDRQIVTCRPCHGRLPGFVQREIVATERPDLSYTFELTSADGLRAEVRYRDFTVEVTASQSELKNLIGL